MLTAKLKINNKTGLHAHPAALLAQCAGRFVSKITIEKDGMEVDGKSIMGLMLLQASYNTEITVCADGKDEKDAISEISGLVSAGFTQK
jgi:phosphocarrier protein